MSQDMPQRERPESPDDPEAAARSICLRLLTDQARSRANLAAKLHQKGIPDDVTERVLDRFTELGLIDDRAYAEAFVAAKHRERGLGRRALQMELRRKGIDPELAERAVQSIDDDAERQRAAELIAKKLDSAILAGLSTARRRLLGMLARRGYSSTVAIDVVNQALEGYVDPLDTPVDEGGDPWDAGGSA